MSVATSRPASPNCCDTGYRITTKAAVGPDTLKREPPVRAITIPATAEVYRPYCGATPLPIASAIASGMAMIPTVIPAIRSRVKREAVYFSFQQASMRARKGITCEENNLFTIMFHPWAHHLSTEWQVKEAKVIQINITDKKTRRSGFLSRARLMLEHSRDGFFVADTTNRFGQHTRQGQCTHVWQCFDFVSQWNSVTDNDFINNRVAQVVCRIT